MGESQSRYSIIERLTAKKLQLMSDKYKLADDLKRADQSCKELEENKKDSIEGINLQRGMEIKEIELEVKRQKQRAANLKAGKSSKEKLYDAEIKAIEKALDKIEAISKSQEG